MMLVPIITIIPIMRSMSIFFFIGVVSCAQHIKRGKPGVIYLCNAQKNRENLVKMEKWSGAQDIFVEYVYEVNEIVG